MQSVLLCTFVLVISIISTYEARRRYPSSGIRCYEELTNSYFLHGESWKMKNFCFERTCAKRKDGTLYIQTKGCPKIKADPNCKLVKRPNQLFPKCCPTVDCGKKTAVDHLSNYPSWYVGR